MTPRLAWFRYGAPIEESELVRAAGRFRAVILQPWEEEAAARLKADDPTTTVLAYQCLSSVRTYEPGPRYTSGVTPKRARSLRSGTGHEWAGYPGHFQQKVWDATYQREWVDNVAEWVGESPFDGVMADNDVFDDYYNTGLDIARIRAGLNELVEKAGAELNRRGRILVPNIAESRREPGRWEKHSRFGGGLEECFFAWGTSRRERLSLKDCLAQVPQLTHPGLSIARIAGTGKRNDPALVMALAAAWVFAPEADVAVTATAHDGYSIQPWSWLATVDLGTPLGPSWEEPEQGLFTRRLTSGWAAVNLSKRAKRVDGVRIGAWRGKIQPDADPREP